jgi:vanillate monooxygenase ferredoxin subunit
LSESNIPPESIEVMLTCVRMAARDTNLYTFERADRGPLPGAEPGAHIGVILANGIERQYSLIHAAPELSEYTVGVKRDANSRGGSLYMHDQLRVGSKVFIMPPRNNFPLKEDAELVVLLAGGIGITPLLSMVHHLQQKGESFELKYFTRSIRHTAFHQVLSSPQLSGKVDFHYALDPDSLRIYLHKLLHNRPEGAHLYACGPRPFMNLVGDIASATWPPESVHMEFFSADPLASSGPRIPFEVKLARTQAVYTVPAEKTILEVLAEHGINISTSCGQGVCGTCITGVLEGTPDHRDAFLSDKERKACDKMMPCVSRAKCERLVLDI